MFVNLVKEVPKVLPSYTYLSEKSINPTYCDIEHCLPLCPHEKKIWVLRGDLILAVGNKNAYLDEGNTNIRDVIDSSCYHYVNHSDRYGHVSLAWPEYDYDGAVYYAGWLYQHADQLSVFIYTGRYHNLEITDVQKVTLEQYISLQFIKAFGAQPIVFFDWEANAEIETYLRGDPFPVNKRKRTYTAPPSACPNHNIVSYYGKTTITPESARSGQLGYEEADLFNISCKREEELLREKNNYSALIARLIKDIREDNARIRWFGAAGKQSQDPKIKILENILQKLNGSTTENLFFNERKRVTYAILLRSVCQVNRHSWSWFWRLKPASLQKFDQEYGGITKVTLSSVQKQRLLDNNIDGVLDDLSCSEAYLSSLSNDSERPAIERIEDGLTYILKRLELGKDRYYPVFRRESKVNKLVALLQEINKENKREYTEKEVQAITTKITKVCAERRILSFWKSDTSNTRCTDDWNAVKNHFFNESEYARYFDELDASLPSSPVADKPDNVSVA